MVRKSLFWGLTLVLVVALINLIIRGRRLEKLQASQLVEVVKEAKPTPTRVLAPKDLEIVQSALRLEGVGGGKIESQTARHEIEIHNKGTVPYATIQLDLNYLDHSGKVLATLTQAVKQVILPGATLKIADIRIDGAPLSAVNSRVTIAYADIGDRPSAGSVAEDSGH